MRRIVCFLLPCLLLSLAWGQKDKTLIESPDVLLKGRAYTAVHALIVGVNSYPGLPRALQLAHAVDDASALRKVLADQYGFTDITVLTDKQATLGAIRTALSGFADNTKIKPDDLVLIYFSGHGQTVPLANGGAMGFLIPSDAKVDLANPTNSAPYLDTCLPMKQIWDYLDLSPAKHAVVIADACFSGLMARTRGVGLSHDSVEVMLARRARQVITAGTGGQKTVERDDLGHGIFTAKLVDELKARAADKGRAFTLSNLFASLQEQVTNATEGKQTPQMGNFDSEGEVVLVPSGVAIEAPKQEPVKADPTKTNSPKTDPPKSNPPKTEPPKADVNPTTPGAVPAGLNRKQGEYYLRLQEIFADGPNRFANLPRKSNRQTTKSEGSNDVKVYEMSKPLPGFFFGGVTDPSSPDAFLIFEGTPTSGMQVAEDYKAAIRALMLGGREQHFDETHWRITDGHYQITLRRELVDTWHPEKVYQNMSLTILRT
ncbi:MAG: caspase domain-containing protein [Fimbriimonadales bacterium]